ncbi:hypothetical protein B0H19DRAFT_1071248 [Mycena capillaripes]|nr:hypothetical protein B0H19DRAFT_1071248 [Mycena capillaripes]
MSSNSVNKVLEYTTVAASALQDVATATQIPFLNSLLIPDCMRHLRGLQNTKFQKERCLRMVEKVHGLLCVLIGLCIFLEDIRSPKILDQIAQYALTLQKLHSCLRAQQGQGTLKRLFKQGEITAQLDSCESELKAASDIFRMLYGVEIQSALVDLKVDIDKRHQELLELVSSRSGSFDNASSMGRNSLNTRSHYCPSYLFSPGGDPRPGGMGKTTLAMAALHHPAIMDKYSARHFISCESANTSVDLIIQIGLHLGLEPSSQLSKIIITHFKQCGPLLLVLDNFETPWEPSESRGDIEKFLSLLADIPSLALLITMRGAERPGKVKWTRPFLVPLEPLSLSASRKIFFEVADVPDAGEEPALDELLDLSGSLPLAVSLMANIASYEGYSATLSRWQIENTALLSDGHNKRSNLEKSITLSLSSPRLSSSPHAKNLISLLSLLPDGIRAEDLIAGRVPIPDVHKCQSLLVRTSLAYIDAHGCLKALCPIREYIRRVHPPATSISRPLRVYFQDLLQLWESRRELPSSNLAPRLVGYLGNINELMLQGLLAEEKSALTEVGHNIINLEGFSQIMLKGGTPLLQRLPHLIEVVGDAGLRWRHTSRCLRNPEYVGLLEDVGASIEAGVRYFTTGIHSTSEVFRFYDAAAWYYVPRSLRKAMKFTTLARSSAQPAGKLDVQLQLLSLETEFRIAYTVKDPYWLIAVAHRAREIAPFPSTYWEDRFTQWEAWGNCYLGNLSRALNLCACAEEILISDGMEGSDRYLGLLDLRAEIYILQSNYIQGRQLHQQIVLRTSPTCSPRFHANSLITVAYLDIQMEREGARIVNNIEAAETIYAAYGCPWSLCTWITAELKLFHGDTGNARAAFVECLSQSLSRYPETSGLCLAALSDPKHGIGGLLDTFRWAIVYLAFTRKLKDSIGMSHALRRLANLHTMLGDEDTALSIFHAALQAGTTMGIYRLRAECMVGIGDIMHRRGDSEQAKEMWTSAHPLFVCSSRMKDAAAVQKRLEQLANSHTLQQDQDGSVVQTANSHWGVVPTLGSDISAGHSSLGNLATLSAPDRTPSMKIKTAADPETLTDVQTML